ncbi:MAG: gephyrin-like molybdotransferase Glp [Pseudomonadota bacterium]
MSKRLIDDCFFHDPNDANRLSHTDAVKLLSERIQPVVTEEQISIAEAAGSIIAQDVFSKRAVPGHTNAAVDGFALSYTSLVANEPTSLRVAGRAAAGAPFDGMIADGNACRIFTGAVMPDGCDTVVMQEDCEFSSSSETVVIPTGVKNGANVRKAGEDVSDGERLYHAGDRLRPQDIAALASVGIEKVSCFRAPRVAVVSTGDEVVRVGTSDLSLGQVFDTNAPMLVELAKLSGADVTDLGVWPDDAAVVEANLAEAARNFDVVLTSGGASLGEEDYMARSIEKLGLRHFWQIAVKPGRPLMFGQIDDTVIVGLPGNPVAVFVCYLLYVSPIIRRLGGAHWSEPRRFKLPANFSISNRKLGRREFWRATTLETEQGLAVEKFKRDGSGLISGLRAADGLIDVPEGLPGVEPGQLVDFIPFSEFGINN